MQDSRQLDLFECFGDLISEEELFDFNEDDKSIATSSSSSSASNQLSIECGGSTLKSVTNKSKSTASSTISSLDEDPDFVTDSRKNSIRKFKPEHHHHSVMDEKFKMKSVVKPGVSRPTNQILANSTKKEVDRTTTSSTKYKMDNLGDKPQKTLSSSASQLASYLLNNVDSAQTVTDNTTSDHESKEVVAHCDKVVYEHCVGVSQSGSKLIIDEVDIDDRSEWFEFDSKEDFEDFNDEERCL